jgi:hypothetical protein
MYAHHDADDSQDMNVHSSRSYIESPYNNGAHFCVGMHNLIQPHAAKEMMCPPSPLKQTTGKCMEKTGIAMNKHMTNGRRQTV